MAPRFRRLSNYSARQAQATSFETLDHCGEPEHLLCDFWRCELLKIRRRSIVFDAVLVEQSPREICFYREIDVLGEQPSARATRKPLSLLTMTPTTAPRPSTNSPPLLPG